MLCALLASQNIHIGHGQGIVSIHPETTIQNLGTISTQGMCSVDKTVINVRLADSSESRRPVGVPDITIRKGDR